MTWGVMRPRLLLPETSEAWPEERRRVVLLHELAHAWRWDYATNLLTRLACAVWWFNPLVWMAARRMAAERERACDNIVLNHGANPAEYAEQLLEIAAGLRPGGWAEPAGIAMARPTKLESRLRAILDANRNRAALTRAAVFSALLVLTAILIPVAMMKAAPGQPPANPQSPIPNPPSSGPDSNAPVPPYRSPGNYSLQPPVIVQPTALDLRISVVTNAIAPVSLQLSNGLTDVLELPIRIENRSPRTITANLAHEGFGGEWPDTGLGAYWSADR